MRLPAYQDDIHIREEAGDDRLGSRGGTAVYDGVDLRETDVGALGGELVILPVRGEIEFGLELVQPAAEFLGERGIVDLLLEHAARKHLGLGREHGCEHVLSHHVTAAVVAQVQDEFAHAGGLEFAADFDQSRAGLDGEGRIGQVAHLLAAAVEDLGDQYGILIHLHGREIQGLAPLEAYPQAGAAEKLVRDHLAVVAFGHRPAVHGHYDVAPVQARLRSRAVGIDQRHDGADHILALIEVIKQEIEAVGGFHAANAAREGVVVGDHLRPAVYILAVPVLVAHVVHGLHRVRIAFPGVHRTLHLVDPEVVGVHRIEREEVDGIDLGIGRTRLRLVPVHA